MSEARKISVRKIVQTSVTVVVTVACITAMLSAARLQKSKKIQGVRINIKNNEYRFIDKDEVMALLVNDKNTDVLNTSVGKLDANKVEKIVDTNQWVQDAEVYIDNDKVVHINLTQRVPVARLFDQAGNSYYLDKDLKSMDLSDKYVHYTTVVTNVPVFDNDSLTNVMRAQIAKVVQYVEHDSFWSAQISQIIVNDNREFEVVPVLGNQKILIGDTTQLDEKFDNLFAFYKKILNRIGWDKYEVLDARYAGQVVATPALPWKPPTGNAISNMNWVKSIIVSDSTSRAYGPSSAPVKLTTTTAVAATQTVAKPVVTPPPAAKPPVQKTTIPPAATAKQVVTKPVVKQAAQTVTNTKPVVAKPVVKSATPPPTNKAAVVAKKAENKPKPPDKIIVAKDTKPKPQAKPTVKKPDNKPVTKKVEAKEKSPPKKKETKEKEERVPKYIYQ